MMIQINHKISSISVIRALLSLFFCHLFIDCVSASHAFYSYGPSYFKRQTTCPQEFYSVVFDAGSTGSRVSVFQFRLGKKGTMIKVNKEYFLSTEPGISSFAKNISGISHNLDGLLEFAKKNVPKTFHSKTHLIFKATAGLRLLPGEDADKIIAQVRNLLQQTGFYIPDINEVEVMSGGEEGLFGWLTANFYLRSLWKEKKKETAVAIDLGGGSVQITYVLPSDTDVDSLCSKQSGKVYRMLLLKSGFNVFTHSALGNGLKSAFLSIMGGDEDEDSGVTSELTTPCFVTGFNSTWQHGRHTYTIRGESSKVSRQSACQSHVEEFVKASDLTQVMKSSQQDLYLFSYFYDVAVWGGIIPKEQRSKVITLLDYQLAAQHYCQEDAFVPEKPFTCLALLYVETLLREGFGISQTQPLHVGMEIKGKQLSWTLGIALATIHDHFTYSSLCDKS